MGDAAVGSIAHILRTAFKDVYEEKKLRDEQAAQVDASAEEGSQQSPPKKRVIDSLNLSDQYKTELLERAQKIEQELQEENGKADELVGYLQKQREIAKQKRIEEEESLKKQGIIIGQHIPPLPSKLVVEPDQLSQFGKFSSNLVIAHDLVEQNKTNTLRRTGNLPISETLEQRKLERGKKQAESEPGKPHFLEMTSSQTIREKVNKVRFDESLSRRATEISGLHMAEDHEPVVVHKKKQMLTGAQRDENDAILRGINHKLNYLRNPRNDPVAVTSKMLTKQRPNASVANGGGSFGNSSLVAPAGEGDAESGSVPAVAASEPKTKQRTKQAAGHASKTKAGQFDPSVSFSSIAASASPLFVTEPKRVLFNGYDLGNEYRKPVAFRNVSAVSRSIRVLPPRTAEFAMSPLQYPQNSRAGLIAPGMSVTTQITFYPNSLMDFNDFLTVETEGGSYTIPILARRESPKLLLPPTFSIGACLVGDAIRTTVRCVNGGGPGNFHVLSIEEFDSGLTESESKECLRMPPFTVYPLDFSIDRHQHQDITIEFVPLQLGDMSQQFVIYSESGHSFKYTVCATSLQTNVYVSEINGTAVNPTDGSIVRDLYFNSACIGTSQVQKVSVTNDTGIPMEYEWVWVDAKSKDIRRAAIDKLIAREKESFAEDAGLRTGAEVMSLDAAGTARLNDFEASLPLPVPPARLVLDSDSPSSARKATKGTTAAGGGATTAEAAPEMSKSLLADSLLREASAVDANGDTLGAPKNAAYLNGFEVSPARAVLGVDDTKTFSVTYSPSGIEQASGRLVLLLRKVTLPGLQDKNQSRHLSSLAINGHISFVRLRSWLADMAEVCPLYGDWVCGSAAACGAQPVALTPDVVKIISLKTLLSLATNYSRACYSDEGQPTPALFTLLFRLREIVRFVSAWRVSEFTPEEDFTPEEEDIRRTLSLTVNAFDWTLSRPGEPGEQQLSVQSSSSGSRPRQVPPVTIVPKDWRTRSPGDAEPPQEPLTAKEKNALPSVWVSVETAIRLLGPEICASLDPLIAHESTDYIQSLVRMDLPCLSFLAWGAGKAFSVSQHPPRLIVGGIVTIGKIWEGIVTFKNPSNVATELELDTSNMIVTVQDRSEAAVAKAQDSSSHPSVLCSANPSSILLLPESEASVTIEMYVNTVGAYRVRIPVIPSHPLTHVDPVNISIATVGPVIRFESPEIDVGLISTGLEGRKSFHFSNDSDVPLRFAFTAAIDPKSVTNAMAPTQAPAATDDKKDRRRSTRRGSKMGSVSLSRSASKSEDTNDDDTTLNSARSAGSVASKDSYTIENQTATVFFEPNSGMAKPGETITVTMVCMGGKLAQRLRGFAECMVADQTGAVPLPTQLLPFRGEIQMPKAVIAPVNVHIGTVFENIPVPFEVVLQNLSNLPSKYKFERPGGPNPLYTVEFADGVQSGTLGPKELLRIPMKFTAVKEGIISDLMACKVFGVPVPIGFSITAVVKCLSLEFAPLPEGAAAPLPLGKPTDVQYKGALTVPEPQPVVPLDSGAPVKLYERKQFRFVIRNLSAISAEFEISPKKYSVGDLSSAEVSSIGFAKTFERTAAMLVPHEDGENKYHSVNGKNYIGAREKKLEDRAFLTLGQGASYGIEPRSGTISPWGVQVVTVYARNDMPGCYDDEIICDVKNFRRVSIPIKMSVEGCPLIVEKDTYVITNFTDPETNIEQPMLLLGNLCKDEEAPERQFRVRNNGSVPTKVKWAVRSITSKVNGPIKVELKLSQDRKISTKFIFWDDLAKETPFLVDPKTALIPAYGSQTFRVRLLRTSNVGSEKGLLTGSVILHAEEDPSDAHGGTAAVSAPRLPGSTAAREVSTQSLKPALSSTSVAGSQYKLNVRLEGNIMTPSIRLDEHIIPVNYMQSVAPQQASIFMRTMVPMLFASGGKSFELCSKNVILANPLTANLVFTVSVEGPFLLKAANENTYIKAKPADGTESLDGTQSVSHPSTLGKTYTLLPEVMLQ
jgi:hypothetical protein